MIYILTIKNSQKTLHQYGQKSSYANPTLLYANPTFIKKQVA